jgi:hypothetical protein
MDTPRLSSAVWTRFSRALGEIKPSGPRGCSVNRTFSATVNSGKSASSSADRRVGSGDKRDVGLDREWIDLKLNDFDDQALEEAVLLKEATAGSVIAVAIGAGAQRTLQMAIARGATSAIAIEWPEEEMLLTPAVAPTVAGLARDHDVDLVMTGVQTSEDILGQAAPFIGGLLHRPTLASSPPLRLLRAAAMCGDGCLAFWRRSAFIGDCCNGRLSWSLQRRIRGASTSHRGVGISVRRNGTIAREFLLLRGRRRKDLGRR